MPAPHPQTPRTDPPRPTVHGTNVSVPPQTADLPQWNSTDDNPSLEKIYQILQSCVGAFLRYENQSDDGNSASWEKATLESKQVLWEPVALWSKALDFAF
ncbi:hypothetical protein J6590_053714 [Homalodisca vitripennis]|nr:hypothetical protein J6590_053714 [Homalodisca vitripennis]